MPRDTSEASTIDPAAVENAQTRGKSHSTAHSRIIGNSVHEIAGFGKGYSKRHVTKFTLEEDLSLIKYIARVAYFNTTYQSVTGYQAIIDFCRAYPHIGDRHTVQSIHSHLRDTVKKKIDSFDVPAIWKYRVTGREHYLEEAKAENLLRSSSVKVEDSEDEYFNHYAKHPPVASKPKPSKEPSKPKPAENASKPQKKPVVEPASKRNASANNQSGQSEPKASTSHRETPVSQRESYQKFVQGLQASSSPKKNAPRSPIRSGTVSPIPSENGAQDLPELPVEPPVKEKEEIRDKTPQSGNDVVNQKRSGVKRPYRLVSSSDSSDSEPEQKKKTAKIHGKDAQPEPSASEKSSAATVRRTVRKTVLDREHLAAIQAKSREAFAAKRAQALPSTSSDEVRSPRRRGPVRRILDSSDSEAEVKEKPRRPARRSPRTGGDRSAQNSFVKNTSVQNRQNQPKQPVHSEQTDEKEPSDQAETRRRTSSPSGSSRERQMSPEIPIRVTIPKKSPQAALKEKPPVSSTPRKEIVQPTRVVQVEVANAVPPASVSADHLEKDCEMVKEIALSTSNSVEQVLFGLFIHNGDIGKTVEWLSTEEDSRPKSMFSFPLDSALVRDGQKVLTKGSWKESIGEEELKRRLEFLTESDLAEFLQSENKNVVDVLRTFHTKVSVQ